MLSTHTYFTEKNVEYMHHDYVNTVKTGVAILILDKVNFQSKEYY